MSRLQVRVIVDEVCVHLAAQELLVLHHIQQERNVRLHTYGSYKYEKYRYGYW